MRIIIHVVCLAVLGAPLLAHSASGQSTQQDVARIVELRQKLQQDLEVGRYADAEQAAQQLIDLTAHMFPDQTEFVAAAKSNLGAIYDAQGNREEAEQIHRSVLEIMRHKLGENSQQYVMALNNLATSIADQGRHTESEPLYLRAIELTRQIQLADHSNWPTIHSSPSVKATWQ